VDRHFKRPSSFTKSHPQNADNEDSVNCIHLHDQAIPIPEQISHKLKVLTQLQTAKSVPHGRWKRFDVAMRCGPAQWRLFQAMSRQHP
jgi:hypothetical protein